MFNKSNFCHIASNNRNDQKGSVFIYKTADTLAQVTQSGYFNEKLIDINLHDLIIHVQYNPVDRTLKKSVLIVTERTLDNVETAPILDQTIGDDIDQLGDQVAGIEEKIPGAASAANQLADKAFVNDIKTAIETIIAGIDTSISTLNNDLSQTNQNLAQTNQDLAQASGSIAGLSNSKADVVYVDQQLATKANADLGNIPANYDYVVESQFPTAENGYTWYRKYKSGWVEQGGKFSKMDTLNLVITLPIEMSTNVYSIIGTGNVYSNASGHFTPLSATTTSFTANIGSDGGNGGWWQVCGMSA